MSRRFRRKRKGRRSRGIGKVKSDIKWLKKNVEFKFLDLSIVTMQANTTPIVFQLNAVPQGTTAQTSSVRDGDELTARRILIQGHVVNNRGTPVDTIVRITLFRDKHPHGTDPTAAELFTTSGVTNINSLRNMDHDDRFKVMADYRFSMDTLAHTLIPFKIIFKLNHMVKYKGTATVPETNGLYLIAFSQVAGTTNNPQIHLKGRYSFCDS